MPGSSPSAPALASSSCCTATPSGTLSAGCGPGSAATHATHQPGRGRPAEHQSRHRLARTGSPHTTSPWPPPGQGDLEAWLASAQPTHRTDAGNFVRWARKHKLTSLDFAAIRWGGPTGVIDTETRWEQARWLLHDGTLKPEDRVAGLLVLLYAQWPATISQLTLSHVQASGGQVRIQLGREPVVLPEPLDALVLQVAAARRGHAAIGDQGTSPWLFPGGQPGRPISAFQLAERLRQIGIRSGQSRSAALFQLATNLPAAVLARMLGIHITVAVAWQRAAAGDWAAYAAEISRRNRPAGTDHAPNLRGIQTVAIPDSAREIVPGPAGQVRPGSRRARRAGATVTGGMNLAGAITALAAEKRAVGYKYDAKERVHALTRNVRPRVARSAWT